MEYLALTVLGENQANIINELTKTAYKSECNIVNCWVANLGTQVAINILLAGNWNEIAKLENQLSKLEKKYNLRALHQRTKLSETLENHMPYAAYIVAMDKPGIAYEVTNFFNDLKIPINELYTEIHPARKSGAMILSISLTISVPSTIQISELRERFFLFCDHFNVDGMLEAEKG